MRAIGGGLSRLAAAAKFDVSIASAVRWHQRFKRQGDVRPAPIGVWPSHPGGPVRWHALSFFDRVIVPVEQAPDGAVLEGMAFPGQFLPDLLDGDAFVFLDPAHDLGGMGFDMMAGAIAAKPGSTNNSTLSRSAWSSWMNAGPAPRWLGVTAAPSADNDAGLRSPTDTGRPQHWSRD